jgi:hypothetical protein
VSLPCPADDMIKLASGGWHCSGLPTLQSVLILTAVAFHWLLPSCFAELSIQLVSAEGALQTACTNMLHHLLYCGTAVSCSSQLQRR